MNKRLPCPFCLFFFFFLRRLFRTVVPNLYICVCVCVYIYIYIYICHEQCCLFEFPSLAVILKCCRRFINSIPYQMADQLHPFMLVLMMLVFRRSSVRIPNTNTLSPSNTNTFFISLSSPCFPSQTLSFVYSDQPLHHDAEKRPKFFLP